MEPIDLKSAQEVHAPPAPVGAPLTGKERAGVLLTWGVLGLIAAFLIVVLIVLGINESQSRELVNALIKTSDLDTLKHVDMQRAEIRNFWLEVIDTVLVNVLLPVLTALLGYVFGTSNRLSVNR